MAKQNNKLGITYSLFNGEELLEKSILQIRDHVDYINVVYQEFSRLGKPAQATMPDMLNLLKKNKLIDNIILYKAPDFDLKNAEKYNINKKMLGVNDLKMKHCSHCMIMDVDEFYITEEFKHAKEYVYRNNITHSCCCIYDYKLKPIYRKINAANYSVPFIFKLEKNSVITKNHNMPVLIDPIRSFELKNRWWNCHKFYYFNSISMHHMTGMRLNFNNKLENSVTNSSEAGRTFIKNFKEHHERLLNMDEENFLKEGYIKVEDIFGLNSIFEKEKR